jgi:hypothetical protein
MGLALAVLSLTVFGWAAIAIADDALIEKSDIERASLAGGQGWLVWASHRADGLLTLRGSQGAAIPDDLHVAPFSRVNSVEVGRGPDGTPTAVYDACRSACHIYALDLVGGAEREIDLPRLPRGCRYARPVIDDRLYVVRTGVRYPVKRRCREGIYELRAGGRLIRRWAARDLYAYAISNRRVAFQHVTRRDEIVVEVRQFGRRGAQVVHHGGGASDDAGIAYDLAWQGRSLWLGLQQSSGASGRAVAFVLRVGVGRRVVCRAEERVFTGFTSGWEPPMPAAWAFSRGAIFYTLPRGLNDVELRRRTDPPLRFGRCYQPINW